MPVMIQPPPLTRRDRLIGWAIFAAALVLFGSLRTPDFNDYDGVQFALAVRDGYDLADHRPHPPGFPLYILAAKGLYQLTGDSLDALTWLSAVGGAASLGLMWWLCRLWRPHERRVAWLATLWLLITPYFWLTSEKELSDIPALALNIAAVAAAWRGIWSRPWRLAATLLVVVGLGFRPQNAPALVIPWAWCLWLSRSGARDQGFGIRAVVNLSLLALGCVMWLAGMIWATGGWAEFREAMTQHWAFINRYENIVVWAPGATARYWIDRIGIYFNTFLMAVGGFYLKQLGAPNWIILYPWPLVLLGALALILWKCRSLEAVLCALWVIPYAMGLYLMFQPSNPRYILPVVPALLFWGTVGFFKLPWPRLAKIIIAGAAIVWLAGVTAWAVRVLRTEPSPLVEATYWAIEQGADEAQGEIDRAFEYYAGKRPGLNRSTLWGSRQARLVAIADRPGGRLLPSSHGLDVISQARFSRPILVHPKHADLRVEICHR